MDRDITCCFSGHRPAGLPWGHDERDARCHALKLELAVRLIGICDAGYRHFICGMAQGCDLYFAEAVLALRDARPDITLEAAVPCATQADRWAASQRERYRSILDLCDQVTVLQQSYTPNCMMRRNRYMVDHSSLLLACFGGSTGGTMNTILYARRSGVNVIMIDI